MSGPYRAMDLFDWAQALRAHHGPAGSAELFGHLHVAAVRQVADQPLHQELLLADRLDQLGGGVLPDLGAEEEIPKRLAAIIATRKASTKGTLKTVTRYIPTKAPHM